MEGVSGNNERTCRRRTTKWPSKNEKEDANFTRHNPSSNTRIRRRNRNGSIFLKLIFHEFFWQAYVEPKKRRRLLSLFTRRNRNWAHGDLSQKSMSLAKKYHCSLSVQVRPLPAWFSNGVRALDSRFVRKDL